MRVVAPLKQPQPRHRATQRSLVSWLIVLVLGLTAIWFVATHIVHSEEERREDNGALEVVDDDNDLPDDLQDELDAWVRAHGSGYRIVVKTFGDDSVSASYKADDPIVPASTYKLFVAFAAYHEAEIGDLSLTTRLTNGSSVEECIEQAIVQSDNDCAEAVGFYIGWDDVNGVVRAAGLTHTELNNYASDGGYTGDKQTTASDLAVLLEKLHDGKLLSKPHTDRLVGYMKRQIYRSGIPAGSRGLQVANKVGFLPGYTSDAAIVYSPKGDYVLVIMSEKTDNWAEIKALTSQLHALLGGSA